MDKRINRGNRDRSDERHSENTARGWDEFTVKQVVSSVKDIESKDYRLETNNPKTKAGQLTIPLLPFVMILLDVQRKLQKEKRMGADEMWTGGMPG